MMEVKRRPYPVGYQDFRKIRNEGRVYIDKTEYVYRMAHGNSQYYFLSRPRRFGKTLLTSTMQYYFQGRRELFEGLAIGELEKEWTEYPVLRFDFSGLKRATVEGLRDELNFMLRRYEDIYGRDEGERDYNQRLTGIIERACKKENKGVVVLIDEYDSPLLNVVHNEDRLPSMREEMRNFYSPLKRCDPYLRFVFLTGITKFSQLSIFSELNNIRNISMLPEYAGICGFTKEELTTQMAEDISLLAERLEVTHDKALELLVRNYDGYHFTWPSPDIFNPYSLLNAFEDGRLGSYWFGSGTPTFLVEMLRRFEVLPSQIGGQTCEAEAFDAPTERLGSVLPLLYQSGYLTIKDYDPDADIYTLDIPNKEVRLGLTRSLIGNYVTKVSEVGTLTRKMAVMIRRDDMDGALRLAKTVLGTMPYCRDANSEGHYQQMLYLMFTLVGFSTIDVEVRTPTGRVDIVLRTDTRLYVMELKFDRTVETAMNQIDLENYPERFALCPLPIVRVGINFDSKTRNISDWKIEEEKRA